MESFFLSETCKYLYLVSNVSLRGKLWCGHEFTYLS